VNCFFAFLKAFFIFPVLMILVIISIPWLLAWIGGCKEAEQTCPAFWLIDKLEADL